MMSKLSLWLIYFPVLKLIHLLSCWVPAVRVRSRFEKKNKSELQCRSFKLDLIEADYCFEFSSEGEYQQVASLIEDALLQDKKIELVFFSASVEKAILELAHKYPHNIRYLRYPLVRFNPWHSFSGWISSRQLILVRYDLFPEFLVWSLQAQNKLHMLWVTFKKERARGKNISWIKLTFLKQAEKIIFASAEDLKLGKKLGLDGELYDFRMEQIRRRVTQKEDKFKLHFSQYQNLKQLWENYPRHKRLIIGNGWPSDLFLFKQLPADVFVMVVPHKLDAEILKAFRDGFFELKRTVEEISDQSVLISANTIILNKKGVLCELYADFGKAYVGGGFEGSIHSVLEPLVAGSDQLACGPEHDRSTEYDLAISLGDMTEVKTAQDFSTWLESIVSPRSEKSQLDEMILNYPECSRGILSC